MEDSSEDIRYLAGAPPSRRALTDAEIRRWIVDVYKQVWTEFYEWEPRYCRNVINRLACSSDEATGSNEEDSDSVRPAPAPDWLDVEESDDPDTVFNFMDMKNGLEDSVPADVLKAEILDPHPGYDSCTPVNQNIAWREGDLNEEKELFFVQFADDPTFDVWDYASRFETFSWQLKDDPDLEDIEMEVIRRLHHLHGLSLADIDRQRIFDEFWTGPSAGLLWTFMQRDHLPFSEGRLLTTEPYHPGVHDLSERTNSVLRHFCAGLDCIQPHCPTHTEGSAEIQPKKAQKRSETLRLDGEPACGEMCFKCVPDEYANSVYWNQEHQETLKGILQINPDLTPCQLSVLCRKPCREVYFQFQRMEIIPDDTIESIETSLEIIAPDASEDINPASDKDWDVVFDDTPDEGKNTFEWREPCTHEGPCNSNSQCSCYIDSSHCQRNCTCGRDCPRRWTYCTCERGNCRTERCVCFRQKRECDPEMCWDCKAKNPRSSRCHNRELQMGIPPPPLVEVKPGNFGLGLFARNTIPAGTFIGEYIGELIYGTTSERREPLYLHRNLNYLFDLSNGRLVVDCARAGTPTMYINHGQKSEINCEAVSWLVNDRPRLKLVTTKKIKTGREILFDYGENYWNNRSNAGA